MIVRFSDAGRRVGVTLVGLVAAGGLVAGCSSSSNGSGQPAGGDPTTSVTTAAGGGSTTPAGGGGGSTTSGGGGGGANPFCTSFDNSALSGISDANSAAAALKAWDAYAKNAPSEIKKNVQNIDKYLHDAVDKNYTALTQEAQSIATDGQAIATYYASHCHG